MHNASLYIISLSTYSEIDKTYIAFVTNRVAYYTVFVIITSKYIFDQLVL